MSIRPHFGSDQVRSRRGIKKGNFYIHREDFGKSYEDKALLKVVREPYEDDREGWSIDVIYKGDTTVETLSLAELSIVPDDDDFWEEEHCLLRTKECFKEYIKRVDILNHSSSKPNIHLVGVGGASLIAEGIAKVLHQEGCYANMTLIDPSSFSTDKNNHEWFSRIGSKVKVKKRDLERHNPYVSVFTHGISLNEQNKPKLLGNADLIIVFTDNNDLKWSVGRYFEEEIQTGILITGGTCSRDHREGFVLVAVKEDGKDITPPIDYGYDYVNKDYKISDRGRDSAHNQNGRCQGLFQLANEVVQLFCYLLKGKLPYDEVEFDTSIDCYYRDGAPPRRTCWREEVYKNGKTD